jgi:rare lipoprotein A
MQTQTVCNARNRHRPFTTAALVLLVTVSGATAQATSGLHEQNTHIHKVRKWSQTGKATWYGRGFQGRKTASGEAFDLNMLTCAHRTLPIGTLLRVTNLSNRRTIMVRVNDRGPVPEGLIADLSYGAARRLGFSKTGTARIRLEKVEGAEAALLNWPDLGRPDPAASR